MAGKDDSVNLWKTAHDALAEYRRLRESFPHVRTQAWADYIAARNAAEAARNQPPGTDPVEPPIEPLTAASRVVQDGLLFQAMCDLEWHGAGHPTIWTRGTHMNWTEVLIGDHAFNIDDDRDRQRLIEWGKAMRQRKANAPLPEPPT